MAADGFAVQADQGEGVAQQFKFILPVLRNLQHPVEAAAVVFRGFRGAGHHLHFGRDIVAPPAARDDAEQVPFRSLRRIDLHLLIAFGQLGAFIDHPFQLVLQLLLPVPFPVGQFARRAAASRQDRQILGAALAGVAGGDPAAVAFKRLQLLSCAGRFQRQVGVEMERHQQPVGLPGGVPDHPAAAPGDGVVPVADEFRHGADLAAAAEESHIQTFGGRTGNAGISPLVRRLFRRDPEVNPVFRGTLRRMDRQRTVVAQPEADRLAVGEYLQGFRRNRQQDFTEVQRGGGIGLFRFRRDPVGSLRHLPVGGTESGEGKQQEQDSTGRTPHYSASVFSSLNARSRRNGGRAKVTGLPASTFSLSSPGRHSPVRGTNQRSR